MYRMPEDNNSLQLGSDENLLWLINYSQRLTSLGQLPKFNSIRTKIPTCRIRTGNSMGDIISISINGTVSLAQNNCTKKFHCSSKHIFSLKKGFDS